MAVLFLALKALHIVAFVAWFAGMFYIWRLFVYHAEATSPDVKRTLDVMAGKLYRIIMVPASIATLLFGFGLFAVRWNAHADHAWIWVKIALVGGLLVLQHLANSYRKRLAAGETFNSKRFRALNEVPTLILLIVVGLAVFKPF